MQQIVTTLDAPTALAELFEGFGDDLGVDSATSWLGAERLGDDFRTLLDHRDHMTRRLGDYWGAPMTLEVLQVRLSGEDYRRKILLRPRGSHIVAEFGIARVWLANIPPAAREDIVSQRAPLGEIFERHALFRQVAPRAFARFASPAPILQYFADAAVCTAYGRIATIYCDKRPAVELLEVVRTRAAAANAE